MTPSDRTPSRLRTLELQGYKTFATKTVFEFAPTITAIVGPNGSGKSNIADAIRWVLGEQAYSLLRGKKTEDMIFSGSEARARAGMAAATITFDNTQGWLPIDFSEVTVGRRAYRDGQNEYMVNDQRVRLRDVGELLAESGLAERTYTVIGQGLVDTALSLRAEERRELFEEAAGIGLYRSRRQEAVRRLENTRRNLERVQDILAELRPRLRSLERQAQRARDYEQVKEDLQSSLRVLYGYHWNRMQRIVAEARRGAREHGQQRGILRRQQDQVDSKLERIRNQIGELRERLQGWTGEAAELYERRELLGRRQAVLVERLRWLEERKDQTQAEVDSLEAEGTALQKAVAVAEEEVGELEERVMSFETEGDGGEKVGANDLRDRRQLEEEIAGCRRRLEELVGEQAAWATQGSALQSRRQSLQGELEAVRDNRQQADEQVEELERQLNQSREALGRSQGDLEKAEAEGRQLRAAEEAAAGELQAARQRATTLEAELARLEARLTTLRELAEGSQAGTLALLAAAERGEIRGLLGRLTSRLAIPNRQRRAVMTALGEALSGLAVREQGDLEAALDYLAGREDGGRTVLVPLEGNGERERGEPPAGEGVIGNAADFVEAGVEMARLAESLLGDTWIVRDRKTALELSRREPDRQLVTEAGELFRADGTVIVGPPGARPDHDERDDLERRQQAASGELEDVRAEIEALQVESEQRAEDLAASERRRQEADGAVAETASTIQSVELELRAASARVESLEDRRQRLTADLEDVRADQRALSSEGEAFDEERARLERRLTELNRQVEHVSRDAEMAVEVEWESARAAKAQAEERLAERRSRLARVKGQLEQWRARLAAVEGEQSTKGDELGEVETDAQALEEEITERRQDLGPAERDLKKAETDRAELEKDESRLRYELQAVENHHSQAQIELARREEELLGLQRRIEDDFGLVAYEFDEGTTGQEPLPLEGLVEKLPNVERLPEGLETQVKRLRAQLRRMGSINPEAQEEFRHVKERVEFMTSQGDDLRRAETQVQEVIAELDVIMAREFRRTFDSVATAFKETFGRLFGGGSARLSLTDPENPNETGIEIEARLPGKREQGLAMLSGGERSLAASALVFALLRVSPTPFCVLDEVDAMLDEANVGRFCDLLEELSAQTQFIVITHNRLTVQAAQAVYGVSMSADSTSKVISLDLEKVAHEVAA